MIHTLIYHGVENNNMNVMCLGGQIAGYKLALVLVLSFLNARFKADERFIRRLAKITSLEKENIKGNITP
jgi:ribose 5-phosphate isomerase B